MNRLRGLPLRWQLTACLLLMVAALLAVFGLLLYRQIDGFLVNDAEARVRDQVALVVTRETGVKRGSRGAKVPAPGADIQRIGDALVRELGGRDAFVTVLLPDSGMVAEGGGVEGDVQRPVPPAVLAQAFAGSPRTQRLDERTLVVLVPVAYGADTSAVAAVTLNTSAAADVLGRLRLSLVVGGLAALALAGLGALGLTTRFLGPLAEVANTANRIANEGDVSLRVGDLQGASEIGRLARAFDFMVERLAQSIQAQQRLVADASHELRTPLAAASGMLEVVLMGAYDAEPSRRDRALTAASRELARVNELVADLLTLSETEAVGNRPAAPLHLDALLKEVFSGLEPRLAGRVFECSLATNLWVVGDALRLRQVFQNLLENALKFTGPNGRIGCALEQLDDQAVVTIWDDGIGIAADALPHIFERFYRADESRARGSHGGSGLGLAIAQATVRGYGGEIQAESLGVGEGSTFRVRLPLAPHA